MIFCLRAAVFRFTFFDLTFDDTLGSDVFILRKNFKKFIIIFLILLVTWLKKLKLKWLRWKTNEKYFGKNNSSSWQISKYFSKAISHEIF